MRYLGLVCVSLLLALCTFGCGGSGNSNSPYAGTFIGTYTNSSTGSGAIALTINSSGQVNGRGINTTLDTTTAIHGSITNSGIATLTDGNGTALGNLTLDAGALAGTLISTTTGSNTTVAISAATAAGAAVGSYAGSFNGTFTDSNGDSGVLTMITNPTGTVTALVVDSTASTIFIATGTITNAGSISIIGGTLTGGNETISGPLAFNASDQLTGILTANTSPSQSLTVTMISP